MADAHHKLSYIHNSSAACKNKISWITHNNLSAVWRLWCVNIKIVCHCLTYWTLANISTVSSDMYDHSLDWLRIKLLLLLLLFWFFLLRSCFEFKSDEFKINLLYIKGPVNGRTCWVRRRSALCCLFTSSSVAGHIPEILVLAPPAERDALLLFLYSVQVKVFLLPVLPRLAWVCPPERTVDPTLQEDSGLWDWMCVMSSQTQVIQVSPYTGLCLCRNTLM